MANMRTLEQAIGAELKRRREAAGVTQDAVAFNAQTFGLEWGQPTISAIEAGRRGVSVGELILLPYILATAGVTPQKEPPDRTPEGAPKWTLERVHDLIPDDDEWVIVAPGVKGRLKDVRWFYASPDERSANAPSDWKGTAQIRPKTRAVTETDRKAARALGVAPEAIAPAAWALWGKGLAEERDDRIGDTAASAQKRGRVTRTLIRELAATLKRRKGRVGMAKDVEHGDALVHKLINMLGPSSVVAFLRTIRAEVNLTPRNLRTLIEAVDLLIAGAPDDPSAVAEARKARKALEEVLREIGGGEGANG